LITLERRISLSVKGLAAVLAGFLFLATGAMLYLKTASTDMRAVNPWLFKPLGIVLALVGLVLLASRDE
jgi:protein-S-isoprenylcysteine O-methyltransferase Ste14